MPPPNLSADERERYAAVAGTIGGAPPAVVHRQLDDGDQLAPSVVVVAVPGHTAGAMAVLLPARGVLLCGDLAVEHDGVVYPSMFNVDTALSRRSLAAAASLDVGTVGFGHGRPVLTAGGAAMRRAMEQLATD